MVYAVASTHRKPGPAVVLRGRQAGWEPAGIAHAVLAKPHGGHHKVTMCGLPVSELHLFERLAFHGDGSRPQYRECRECGGWVQAEQRRLKAALFGV
jgi:hypothetical protein